MSNLDIRDALAQHYAAFKSADRGDEERLHIADLYKCPREVWARRNGKERLPFTLETRRKFEIGFHVEREVAEALRHAYPEAKVLTDTLVWLDVNDHNVLTGGELAPEEVNDSLPERIAIGHPDIVVLFPEGTSVLVEVKSTLFFEREVGGVKGRNPDLTPQMHYVLQAAGYGLALDADEVHIAVSCVQSGKVSPPNDAYVFNPHRYRDVVATKLRHLQKVTAIGAPEPPAEPPDFTLRRNPRPGQARSWMCDFCPYAGCPANNNPERLKIAL